DVEIEAERLTEQAARIANAALVVDAESHRQRVQLLAVGRRLAVPAEIKDLAHFRRTDLAPADVDLHRDLLRGRPAAADADEHLFHHAAGHALGGVDGGGHGRARALDVDDGARTQALARLMTDADHGRPAILLVQLGDEARGFAGAEVEDGDHVA